MNDVSASSGAEWITGTTPTFVSATSFTVVGDQTTTYQVGRRVKTNNTGGTIYSRIVSSVFGALTTVTVVNDSGTLDSGLSAVSYGLLEATNPSIPLVADTQPLRSGSADRTKVVALEVDGLTTGTTRTITMPDYNVRLSNFPAGIISVYAGSTAPAGWMECNGSTVSRTTYAALFSAISTAWGGGNSSTTFNLPDLRGRVIIGSGTGQVVETVSSSAFSVASSTMAVASNNTKWITGMLASVTVAGTAPTTVPANLLDNGDSIFVVRLSSTSIAYASTMAAAQNGVTIGISSTGACIFTLTNTLTPRTVGEYGGEDFHAQSISELVAHTHSTGSLISGLTPGGGANAFAAGGNTSANIPSAGGAGSMNIMQPFATAMSIISY